MCPGTLFMVKFVNKLEARYPFADNLLPVTKLASVLLADDKSGFAAVGWMFTRLIATTSWTVLETERGIDLGTRLLSQIQGSRSGAAALDAVLSEQKMDPERQWLAERGLDTERLARLMFALLGRIDQARWQELFTLEPSATALGSDVVTLSALKEAARLNGKDESFLAASKRARLKKAHVVVMGHTHEVDQRDLDGGARYFNPGCWTRFLELEPGRLVTLQDLEDESKYPYALNVVRVEPGANGLVSRMETIDRAPA